jgi:branched-chain amino acid transport system substrate-binding protein
VSSFKSDGQQKNQEETMNARHLGIASALLLSTALTMPAWTQTAAKDTAAISYGTVKIGVLTDLSGPASSSNGLGSVIAAQMAAEDAADGLKVEVVSADHQGKPDTGMQIAGRWFDVDGVDAVADMQGSPIGFAVQNLARQKSRIMLLSGSTSSDFSGKACSPLSVQWTVDTYGLAQGAAKAISAAGGKKWYFLTVDQAYGHALTRDTIEQVKKNGGEVLGNSVFPSRNLDFSSVLLRAQSAKPDVIAIASARGDTETAMKQAEEFGLSQTAKIVPLQSTVQDMKGIGLKTAQGAYEVAPFYWDRNDETREWANRFFARARIMPSGFHAGVYSSVVHYLKAVKATETDEATAVMKRMESQRVNDFFAKDGYIRADRKMVHDMYLLQVKKPSEAKGEWDLYNVVQTLPGESLARPLAESECPLVTK